jgi:hypothetical protein
MAFIRKQDTDGSKPNLSKGELGYDDYIAGGDQGRVYVGTGSGNIALATKGEVDTHVGDTSNPHSVTKAQVGLSNVDNTSDANKPVSTATQTALDAKLNKADNLNDLPNKATARTNLGLSTGATSTVTTSSTDTTAGRLLKVGDNVLRETDNANKLGFDNTGTNLVATNVQQAITEVNKRVSDFTYDATVAWVSHNQANNSYISGAKPIACHMNMKRCVLNRDTKAVMYYLDSNNSTLQADGVTPAVLDGSTGGDVMVEIPRVWYRIEHKDSWITLAISATPREGFVLHPMFADNVQFVYASAYDACVYDVSGSVYLDGLNSDNNTGRVDTALTTGDKLASVSGRYPMVGLTRVEFRRLAKNSGYEQHTFWLWQLIQLLYVTEYGNWNSQAQIGNGNVSRSYPVSSSSQTDSPHVAAGLSNYLGNATGAGVEPNPFISYRGLENIWGNCWNLIDGYNVFDRQVFVSNDETTYADNTMTGHEQLGVAMPVASSVYVRSFQKLDNALVPLSVSGASSSTYLTDALWTSTGWRVGFVGGHASSDGVLAGVGALFADLDSGFRSRRLGARCCYRKKFV